MKSLKKKRRIQVLAVAALALVISTALIGYAMRNGINYFRAPSQLATDPPKSGEVFRLGGLVEKGTLRRGEGKTITFTVTDGGATVKVRFAGVLPDLFAEGQGMIGTGTMVDGTFVASKILARHDENYTPRELVGALGTQGIQAPPGS